MHVRVVAVLCVMVGVAMVQGVRGREPEVVCVRVSDEAKELAFPGREFGESLTRFRKGGFVPTLHVQLQLGDEEVTVHLTKKHAEQVLFAGKPSARAACRYAGTVGGHPDAFVDLHGCHAHGLWGSISLSDETYYVEPHVSHESGGLASCFPHKVVTASSIEAAVAEHLPGLEPVISLHPGGRHKSSDTAAAEGGLQMEELGVNDDFSYVLEVLVVTDRALYTKYSVVASSDAETRSLVRAHVEDVFSLVGRNFESLGLKIRVAVRGVEYVTNSELDTRGAIDATQPLFKTWGNDYQSTVAHDMGVLLLGDQPGSGIGVAPQPAILCPEDDEDDDEHRMYAVVYNWIKSETGATRGSPQNVAITASIVTHEMGHSLSLPHLEDIGCSADGFFMRTLASSPLYKWSSCSKSRLRSKLSGASCLKSDAIASTSEVFCSSGFYAASGGSSQDRCRACDSSCSTCSGSGSSSCTRCPGTQRLSSGQCAPTCPFGYFRVNDLAPSSSQAGQSGYTCDLCSSTTAGSSLTCEPGQYIECDETDGGNPECKIGTIGSNRPVESSSGSSSEGAVIAASVSITLLVLILVGVGVHFYRQKQHGQDVPWLDRISVCLQDCADSAVVDKTAQKQRSTSREDVRPSRQHGARTSSGPGALEGPVIDQSPWAATRTVNEAETQQYAGEAEEAPLPYGWECFEDQDGNPYYYQSSTGLSQWDRPV